jgi:hypothetical protein
MLHILKHGTFVALGDDPGGIGMESERLMLEVQHGLTLCRELLDANFMQV